MMSNTQLLQGDCLERLKELPDNSVDSVVTDPPYGLSFMGKKWDYDVPSEDIWRECLRVLKPGGHMLAFAGTRTQHRMAVRIEDAGFEIRDMIAWVYGSGFPKSHNVGKAITKAAGAPATEESKKWEGWGTALKPALEPITVARKPIVGTVASNVLEYGTGAINVDGCRVGTDAIVTTSEKGFAGSFGGGKNNNGGAVHIGRWPANLIHDGSHEVVELFPSLGKGNSGKPYVYSGKQYNNKHTSMFNGDKPEAPSNYNDSGSAARFFYCAKANKLDRDEGCESLPEHQGGLHLSRGKCPDCGIWKNAGEEKCKCGGEWVTTHNPPPSARNYHPTVKPTSLMRYLCRLVTPLGGTVLDPFMGSGSTGKAAILEGMSFIGIEREADYFEIAKTRIENEKNKGLNEFF